jgi:hypothetical protein
MPARRSFSLKFLCFEFTKQVIWTKGSLSVPESLEETWSFQLVPERLLPSILAIASTEAVFTLEQFLLDSMKATGPWSVDGSILIMVQLAIVVSIFLHTIRRT